MDCGGDTAYVFIAMIVLSDENGIIKHTAESLARAICKEPESVRLALENLSNPDPKSNLKAHQGRRIVPLSEVNEDETRGWFVVNKQHYRDTKDLDVVRQQTRERVRKYRERNACVTLGNAPSRSVTQSNAPLRHTDTDTDTDITAKFGRFWDLYPKKTAKQDALKALLKLRPDGALFENMLGALEAWKGSAAWQQESGKFIPHPATWINGRRWEDELPAVPDKKVAMA